MNKNLNDSQEYSFDIFSEKQKQEIFSRDKFCCVLCGESDISENLRIGIITNQDKCGTRNISNGITLCPTHYSESISLTPIGASKKMFKNLCKKSKQIKDEQTNNFCKEVLKVFEKNNVNGHIEWKE